MRRVMTISAALIVLLAMAVPAVAKTDRIPFSGTDTNQVQVDPGRMWFSDDGRIMHVRGSVSDYTSISNMPEFYSGTATIVVNWNYDFETESGRLWGTSNIAIDDNSGFAGTWVAEWTGDGFAWVGHGLAKGYGDLEGYQQRYDLESIPGGDAVVGFTFMPGNTG